MPRVWNKRDPKMPLDNVVYVGRPTKWGNPYSHLPNVKGTIQVETRDKACEQYEKWFWMHGPSQDIEELRGKDLVCWCAPQRCHADFLLRIANQ